MNEAPLPSVVVEQSAPAVQGECSEPDQALDRWGKLKPLRREGGERSEPDELLITDRTSRKGLVGAASSGQCPRKGLVWLQAQSGQAVLIATNCKTWKCLGCRDRLVALFKARVETGVSRLGRCAFMTVTYQADSLRDVRARSVVVKDWAELWRLFRKDPEGRKMVWLRVMEVTKRGIPHHHVVMGTIPPAMAINCWSTFSIKGYNSRWGTCECLAHRVSRIWWRVTGDSYIVHTIPVKGAPGAASYMAKYLLKWFGRGVPQMRRRWSSSQGWPAAGRMRLKYDNWLKRSFGYGFISEADTGGPEWLLERVGDDLTKEMAAKRMLKKHINTVKGMQDATNVGT